MNPFYGKNKVEYFQFLRDVILPDLKDQTLRKKLINTLTEDIQDDDLSF